MKLDMFTHLSLVTFSPSRSEVTTGIPFTDMMFGVSYLKGDKAAAESLHSVRRGLCGSERSEFGWKHAHSE
ncbi:hypothetical protein TNCV_3204731 [Trichonephila clavipes]|nr:hypothetical protein TNCV_3204731 [Trichonephila clavipes]